MKLTALFLLVGLLQVSASSLAQNVTLSASNAKITTIFKQIKQQTGYDFAFTDDILQAAKPVTIHVEKEDLKNALHEIFADQPLDYKVEDKSIVVTVKKRANNASKVNATVVLQNIDVSAKVVDELGNPLAGATVKVGEEKNSSQTTSTDKYGKFNLHAVNPNDQITITFIGYETQTFRVKDIVNGSSVTLKASSTNLHEVIVNKGYYNEREALSTGDATTINGKQISQQPVNNPILALEGMVPGAVITQVSGVPGAGVNIQIRGTNSISQGNDPLYVVDGVPFSPYLQPGIRNNPAAGALSAIGGENPLSFFNLNDIESITVLKDADATAIYGSRGANGVILITTKKGQAGGMQADINVNQGLAKIDQWTKLMNTQQYLDMRKQAYINDGTQPSGTRGADLLKWSQTAYTDWEKIFIGGTADYTNVDGQITGGSTNTQYLISGNYHRSTTVFPSEGSDRTGGLHFDLNSSSSNNKFKVDLSGSYIVNDNKLPGIDYTSYSFLPPNAPSLLFPNGLPDFSNILANPYVSKFEPFNASSNNLFSRLTMSYEILNNLHFQIGIGYNRVQSNQTSEFMLESYPAIYNIPGSTIFENDLVNTWTVDPQLTYHKTLGKGEMNAILGGAYENRISNSTNIIGNGYTDDAYLTDIQAATSLSAGPAEYEQYKIASLYGRLNYQWDSKYVLNLTGRRDGSSRFGPGKQYGNFGSFGTAWIFSNEAFIKNNLYWLSFGKLRASYGSSGNEPGTSYQYLELYGFTGNTYQGSTSISNNGVAVNNFAWEVDKKLEIGLELGFFNDHLNVSGSYFRNRTGNQLLNTNLSAITGFNNTILNLPAVVQNTGLEFEMHSINIKSKDGFKWTSDFNISHNANKLVSFPGLANSGLVNLVIGQPIGAIQLYQYAGINPVSGLYQFKASNGQLTSTPSVNDKTQIINITPKFYGGLRNTFSYKHFQLDVLLNFRKQIGLNAFTRLNGSPPGYLSTRYTYGNLPEVFVNNTWTTSDKNSQYQKLTASSSSNAATAYTDLSQSTGAYVDASFIRLQNAAFSYNISGNGLKKIGINGVRFFVNAQNLFTITGYKWADPETQSMNTLPPLRVITGGMEIKF